MCDFMYRDSEIQMDTHLILYIEEHDIKEDFHSIDNKIFIGWDKETQRFYVRGKRQNIAFAPYALYYSSADKLYDFVEFVIGTTSTTSLVLYNFNNIKSLWLEDLTYDYLETLIDKNYEIAGYDKVKLKRKRFIKCLSMLV